VPGGVLRRWREGLVPPGQGSVPPEALAESARSLPW